MSNYTKSTNFATKDNLTPGDPLKVVRGTEIDTEYNNIATAIATKTDNASAAITGGSITGITDLAVADGGTGASTAAGALNNLLPSQTGNANKYLQTDGTNATWDAVSLSTADITGTLPVANGGTGVTSSTGTGSVVLSNSPTLVTPALGTPASGTATNLTGLPISTGVSGLGTGVATFLGTPSSANLASAVSDETGSGALVFANTPTLVTPILGTPTSATLTNATGLPISTGVSGLGTGVATFLATPSSANLAAALTDETGTGSAVFATSPTLVTPTLGVATATSLQGIIGNVTPAAGSFTTLGASSTATLNTLSSSGATLTGGTINGMTVGATTASSGAFTTVTASTAIGTASGGTGLGGATPFTSGGVVYASSSSALATGSALTWNTTTFGVGGATVNTAGDNVDFDWLTLKSGVSAGNKKAIVWQDSGGTVLGRQYLTYTSPSASIVWGSLYNGGTNNSDLMTLTPTGLGIGTSSPAAKLHIAVPDASVDGTKGVRINNAAGTTVVLECGVSSDSFVGTTSGSDFSIRSQNIERLKFPNAGGVQAVTTISVGNATPSASGAGITFPATQSASSDANTLDDYEEGTWTATLVSSGGGSVTISSVAKYIKVGNQVLVTAEAFSISTSSLSAGSLTITGLPFTCNANSPAVAYFNIAGAVSAAQGAVVLYASNSTTMSVYLSESTSSSITQLLTSDLSSSVSIRFNGVYLV